MNEAHGRSASRDCLEIDSLRLAHAVRSYAASSLSMLWFAHLKAKAVPMPSLDI